MLLRLRALPLCLLVFLAAAGPPKKADAGDFDVRIRYRIAAFGNERIRHYTDFRADLDRAGFQRDPDDPVPDDEAENPKATLMRGTVPAAGVKRLLGLRPVKSLVLTPAGAKWPDKGVRVRTEVTLEGGYLPKTQRDLAGETAAALARGAGFVEAVGYDHRDHTRLVGSVPVENLDRLHGETSKLPDSDDYPLFRKLAALRVILVRPDLPAPSGRPKPAAIPPEQLKFDPALRAALAAAGRGRLEVILGNTPSCRDRTWIAPLARTGAAVEGRIGPLVSVSGNVKEIAPKLAALEGVVAVRLPRVALQSVAAARGDAPEKWEPIRASGLDRLHDIGLRGKGTRVALVADDFAGWESLKGRKDGKAKSTDPILIDMTITRNPDLRPDPYPSAGKDVAQGHGTRCASALLKAAPEVELTLIRVDAGAPYMVEEVARAVNGEPLTQSLSLDLRFQELRNSRRSLEARGEDLLEERKLVFSDVREDDTSKKLRLDYQKKQQTYDAELAEFSARESRYLRHLADVKRLKGVGMVASGLVWVDGYPVDGTSALSRYFDDSPFKAALWFQAAGDARGQAWAGPFRDADANGVMEFSDPKTPLPKGAWSREVSFLSWQPAAGAALAEMPQGARVRITLQWREPHDCLPLRVGEDVYREPLAKLRLLLVRQGDPTGKSRPVDDLDVIAESASLPQRLDQSLTSATWEHSIELRLPAAGRYGVLVEGAVPETTQAQGEVRLPSTKRFGELRTRVFVNTLGGASRAVWADYPTESAALGMPADARRVVTVGAADAKDRARPSSSTGSPFGMELLPKPNVLAYDNGGGTGEAACFAAGLAASSWGSRGTLLGAIDRMARRPGEVLRAYPK